MNKNTKDLLSWGLILLAGYLSISALAYRVSHPELTETQLMFHLWEAFTWQW